VGRRDQLPTDALLGIHVLVVDDDEDSRNLLRMVLEYCGALVTVVPSAEAAMRTLSRITPDILVADIAMPDRDGYWLIQQVRALARERGGGIPAVAITAHGDEHGPERTLPAGFDIHVRKPIDPWDLCQALSALARRG